MRLRVGEADQREHRGTSRAAARDHMEAARSFLFSGLTAKNDDLALCDGMRCFRIFLFDRLEQSDCFCRTCTKDRTRVLSVLFMPQAAGRRLFV